MPPETGPEILYASVHATLDKAHLAHTISSMLGYENAGQVKNFDFEQDREVALYTGGVSFDSMLRAYYAMIDSLAAQPQALAMSGLDDAFYRTIAMMLRPELFLADGDKHRQKKINPRALENVCGYIQANLNEPLRLSDLERISGLSARALQYAFKRARGCTPMQWVRQQRLERARLYLSAQPPPALTITTIASFCGFTHLGEFTRSYFAYFGERPSETLKRANNR